VTAVWEKLLGSEVEVTTATGAERCTILAAYVSASELDHHLVSNLRFVVAIKDDGTVLDVLATVCQVTPNVAGGMK
jgi:hypothetical protein